MITYSMSPQLRAVMLNVYMDSSVVCPSILCPPIKHQLQTLVRTARNLIPAGRWAGWFMVSGIWPMFGIRGAPRHPDISCRAAHVRIWTRGDHAAPDGFPDLAVQDLASCASWVNLHDGGVIEGAARKHTAFQNRLRAHLEREDRTDLSLLSTAGTGIYLAIWHRVYGAQPR